MELGREDGARGVAHALVAAVVQVDEVLLPIAGQTAGVNGVTVVLAGNVALASSDIQSRDVVSSVAVLELDGASANSQSKKLVAQADAHDGNLRRLHQGAEVVYGLLAVSGVTGAVGDEDTIEVVGHLLDLEVVREHSHAGASADQTAENVLLDTTVDQGNVVLGVGRLNNEGGLGADALDQVDLARVDKGLILIGVVLVANGDSSQRGTLLSEEGDNLAGIDTRDSRDALASAPIAQTLDSGPVAVLLSNISNHHSGTLNVGRLEVFQEVVLIPHVGGNTIVANQGLSEDDDLAAVGGVGHRFGVANERGSEDGLARDVGIRTEGGASEDRAISNGEGGLDTRDGLSGSGNGGGHLSALASESDGAVGPRCRRDGEASRLGFEPSCGPEGSRLVSLGSNSGEHVWVLGVWFGGGGSYQIIQ